MIVNHVDVVEAEFRRQPPQTGAFPPAAYEARLQDFFAFQRRVMMRLAREYPTEQWGYLKIGGENLIDGIKVGRVCDPTGQLYKIGLDIPTSNTPAWNEDGLVQNDHGGKASDYYVSFDGGAVIEPPPPPPLVPDGDLQLALSLLRRDMNARIDQVVLAMKRHDDDEVARFDLWHKDVAEQLVELRKGLLAMHLKGRVAIRAAWGTGETDLQFVDPPAKKASSRSK